MNEKDREGTSDIRGTKEQAYNEIETIIQSTLYEGGGWRKEIEGLTFLYKVL